MTAKERVITTISHEEPDRVPVGEFAIDYAVIEKILGRKSYLRGKHQLIKALWEGRRDEAVDSIKRDTVDLTLELGLDMVRAPDRPAPPYDDPAEHIDGLRIPTESELEVVDYVLERLGDTHYVWTGPSTGPSGLPFHSALWVEPWLVAIAEEPERVRQERLDWAEHYGRVARYWKQKGLDGLCAGEDLGYNSGPFMSRETFRELFLPGYQAQARAVHDAGLPCMFHSCGNLTPIWSDLAETGFDAYQAIQPEEDLARLKSEVGDRISLWGGVSCHNLCLDSPAQIREETARACETCMVGGGFILGSSHSVGVATRPENLLAMIEAAEEYGRYRASSASAGNK